MNLLVIGVPELYESRRLKLEGRKMGHKVTVSRFQGLVFEAGGKQPGRVLLNGRPIEKKFDTVYIRYFFPYVSEALFLAEWADRNGLKVIDRTLATGNYVQSKTYGAWKLAAAGLPVVPGFQATDMNQARQRLAKRQGPIVAKGVHGSKGKYVFRLDNPKKDAAKLTENLVGFFTFQDYVEVAEEYRVLVIGGKYFGAIRKTPTGDEFRGNVSLGAETAAAELDAKTRRQCEKAAKAMGYQLAGVDLAVDKRGSKFFLEVNRSPGFSGFEEATGLNVARRFLEMAAESG